MCCSESTTVPDKKITVKKRKKNTPNKQQNQLPHTQWEGREKYQLQHTPFTPQGRTVSTAWIGMIPGLKATNPPRSSEHPETKGTVKSYLAELLLKLPIPWEVCTRAVPSGKREHPQCSSGIGQTRVCKVHELNIHEISHMDRTCSQELWPVSPDSFYTKAHLHTQSPRGWQVPRFIPLLGGQS